MEILDYKRTHFLLDKYWRCKTSVEEERELRLFFSGENVIPPEFRPYEYWFRTDRAEALPPLGEDFDRRILEQITHAGDKKKYKTVCVILSFVIAAGLAGLILIL